MLVCANAGVAGDLMICRLSRTHGSVHGDDEMFILCSSVKKGDCKICGLLSYSHAVRLSYGDCLEASWDRSAVCRVVYDSCAQRYAHKCEQFFNLV